MHEKGDGGTYLASVHEDGDRWGGDGDGCF